MSLRPLPIVAVLLALVAVLAPGSASAASKTATAPVVTSVRPLEATVGQTLVLRGRGFRVGRGVNRVAFKRDGARAVFVKAREATRTRMWVTVPAELEPLLQGKSGSAPTRFRLRVLARRLGRRYTPAALSPRVRPVAPKAPAVLDCDRDGRPDPVDLDDDADLLDDALETTLGTGVCDADSDDDGSEDGWEYRSAYDLNQLSCPAAEYPTPCTPALPHPRKRPYPNPLFADATLDFDRDGLTSGQEHAAWKRHGRVPGELWYSDGRQASLDASPADGCRGLPVPAPPAPGYSLDLDGDGCLGDDERDEDGDLLTNYDETTGPLSGPGWYLAVYKEAEYPLPYAGTDWLDADSDGDGLIDGLDDQDFDDFLNLEERSRHAAQHGLMWMHPFNPCLPSTASRTCDRHPPVEPEWPPFARKYREATGTEVPRIVWPLWPWELPPVHLIPK